MVKKNSRLISFQCFPGVVCDGLQTEFYKSYFVLLETKFWKLGVGVFSGPTAKLAVGWRKFIWLGWSSLHIQLRVLWFAVRYQHKTVICDD